VPLVPVGAAGFVQIASCVVVAEVACDETQCQVRVEQTYRLLNRDRLKEAPLRVGLLKVARGEAVRLPTPTLRDGQGTTLQPVGSTAQHSAVWDLRLGRQETKTLVLSYAYPAQASPLVRWGWEMPLLAPWGVLESARVELRLPGYYTDDTFPLLEPRTLRWEGRALVWEYETPKELPTHRVVLIAPPALKRLRDLQAKSAQADLARLYLALQEAAQREGATGVDYFGQAVAAFHAALVANPADVAARVELAQLYRARAEVATSLRLNYLMLAAQELEAALGQRAGDTALADALSRIYYDAALLASQSGDPAGALTYFKKAEVPGATVGQQRDKREDLVLRWALNLAEQGEASQALAQLEGVLAPAAEEALLRYAPPLTAARTEVEQWPAERVVRYELRLYPPTAKRTLARLQELGERLHALGGLRATLTPAAEAATLEVRVAHRSLAELRQRAAALAGALTNDADLLIALIAAPWQANLLAYDLQRGLWRDLGHYQERIDLRALQAQWEKDAQYTNWQLIEVRNTPAQGERAQIEQRLGLIVLDEQRRVWERLPSGSYWLYRVSYGSGALAPPASSWLLSWGQVRELEVTYPLYHWPTLLKGAGALLVALALVGWFLGRGGGRRAR
jgi:hypothetical protein